MARKIKTVTVTMDGRDKGKTFVITEMPAFQAERWANRAIIAIFHGGGNIDDHDLARLRGVDWENPREGMATLALMGAKLFSGLNPDTVQPLLDEMMACVQRQPDPRHPEVLLPFLEHEIEEVSTIYWLRGEILSLHTGFSLTGGQSKDSGTSSLTTSPDSSTTGTSPQSSAPSSQPN